MATAMAAGRLIRKGSLVTEMFALLRELIPTQFPLHALGIGHPQNILAGYNLGYQII